MQLKKNTFKELAQSNQPHFGIWNGIVDTYVAEICAGAGFDWVLVDGEHAPFDLRTILHQLQAIENHSIPVLVRPPSGDNTIIKRLLDIGVQTLLIPMVETPEQAQRLAKAVKYPPYGIRGVGSALSRAAQWKRVDNYLEKADEEICLIIQIESVLGMQNLEAILKIEGIDGVFIGPADLAASMGMIENPMHEKVVQQVSQGLQKIAASGKMAGVLAVKPSIVQHYIQCGASMIGVGVDLILLAKATTELAKTYKQL